MKGCYEIVLSGFICFVYFAQDGVLFLINRVVGPLGPAIHKPLPVYVRP